MRLRDVQQLLKDIEYSAGYIKKESGMLSNLQRFRLILAQLENTNLFVDEINRMHGQPIFTSPQDKMQFTAAEAEAITYQGNSIMLSANKLLKVVEELVPELTEFTLSIKLPDTHDMKPIYETLKTLETAFSQIVNNDTINGQIQIENWEHGSFWINIGVGSLAAVAVLGTAVWSSAVISNKFQQNKIMEHQASILGLKKESIEDLVEKQKASTDLLIDIESRAVYDKNFTGDFNNDQYMRVKGSIVMLAELIQEGTEIHPSLTAPEKVNNLFPDFTNMLAITSNVKQIENK